MPGSERRLAARSTSSGIDSAAQAAAELAGDERGPFEGDRPRQQKLSPARAPPGRKSRPPSTSPIRTPMRIGSADRERDFRVAADERDAAVGGRHRAALGSGIRPDLPSSLRAVSAVTIIQRGVAPRQARSLALTSTRYRAGLSLAKVIGSDFTTSVVAPRSIAAASPPMPGPTIDRRIARAYFAIKLASSSAWKLADRQSRRPPQA